MVVSAKEPVKGAILEARTGGCLRVALAELTSAGEGPSFFGDRDGCPRAELLTVEGLLAGELDESP